MARKIKIKRIERHTNSHLIYNFQEVLYQVEKKENKIDKSDAAVATAAIRNFLMKI